MNRITKNTQEFISLFTANRSLLEESSTPELNSHRSKAIETFQKLGLPTKDTESYKYTDINKLFDHDYGIDLNKKLPITGKKCDCKNLIEEAYTINSHNGCLKIDEQIQLLKEKGITICSLQEAEKSHSELLTKYYNKQAENSEHAIVALNTAFVQNGIFVHVAKNTVLDKPIQFVNQVDTAVDLMIFPRKLLLVEGQAKVEIFDYTYAVDCQPLLSNIVTELYAETNSQVAYYNLQNQCEKATILDSLFVSQKRDSKVNTNTISLYGRLIRNNITVALEEENCENGTYGLYLAKGDEHIDNYSTINHIAPHCTSWEHFKGILDDNADTGFCGRIHVYPDAQKTEAYQTNNNLLLSNNAKANTKPQLIIEADDVSCSHGATVGQLDEQALFYLRARGIHYKESYRIMMAAFMNEIIEKITCETLRNNIEEMVAMKMNGGKTYCNACNNDKIK